MVSVCQCTGVQQSKLGALESVLCREVISMKFIIRSVL